MGRILVAAVLGIAVGAAAANVFLNPAPVDLDAPQRAQGSAPESALANPSLVEIASVTGGGTDTFAAEVAAYRFASEANSAELTAAFEATIRRPVSRNQQLLLGVIIARLAEIDPARALALLRDADLDAPTLSDLGLSWLDAVGTTAETIDDVIGLLPDVDGRRLRLAAIAQLAAESPNDALTIALAIEPRLPRVDALRTIADVMAEQDPYAALAYAESIPDEPNVVFRPAKQSFQATVLRQLARVNLPAAIDYIERNVDPDERRTAALVRAVVNEARRADPLTALEIAQQAPGWVSSSIEESAVRRLARQDPSAALAYADSLPFGQRRQNLRHSIAADYGEVDPTAAVAWVQSLDVVPDQLAGQVLEGIARSDPLQALELLLSDTLLPNSSGRGGGFMLARLMGDHRLPNEAVRPRVTPTEIAARLFAIEDEREREAWMSELVDHWSARDPTAALDWLNVNQARVTDRTYLRVAQNMAQNDPETALRYGDQVAPAIRDEWIRTVARTMIGLDPANAAAWIGQFRGEPMYETIAMEALPQIAGQNVVEALDVFNGLGDAGRVATADSLARAWAREDPIAAHGWITSMPDSEIRDAALSGYLTAPEENTRSGISGWVRGPGGAYFMFTRVRLPEPATLALFSSDTARQEAVIDVVANMAHYDPAQARGLVDSYVSDPALLSQAERTLRWAGE